MSDRRLRERGSQNPGSGAATVEIATERLQLLLPGEESAAQLLDYFERNRRHLEPWSPPPPPDFYTLDYFRRRLMISRQEYAAERSLRLAIYHRSDRQRIIGTCNYSEIVRGGFQACFLGYGIDAKETGKGLMTEAVRESLRFVFGQLKLHRVMANYIPSNRPSARLLRRLGFVVEGYARDYLFINGAWRDHVLTALSNPAAGRPR